MTDGDHDAKTGARVGFGIAVLALVSLLYCVWGFIQGEARLKGLHVTGVQARVLCGLLSWFFLFVLYRYVRRK